MRFVVLVIVVALVVGSVSWWLTPHRQILRLMTRRTAVVTRQTVWLKIRNRGLLLVKRSLAGR